MKNIYSILLILFFSIQSFSQDKFFCPTYVYEGFIKTDKEEKLEIKLNFLVLLDSTLVGSYYYKPQNVSLKLVGQLNKNNTFNLVERDTNESITGFFNGQVTTDKSKITGLWTTPNKDKTFNFELNQIKGKSYWDFIQKNRDLFEYKDLKQAIRKKEKVLSIDVASQNLKKLPKKLYKLTNIVSINLLGNQFTEFPSVLSELKTLDEISLSTNKLTKVGSEIGQLKNLRILIMNNNQLTSLPKEIGELTNLLYLEIGNNELTNLPEEIKYLTSLQELHIERNKLSEAEKIKIKKLLPNCVIHF
jgi:Leucine-rich repeat (LRR) protein